MLRNKSNIKKYSKGFKIVITKTFKLSLFGEKIKTAYFW